MRDVVLKRFERPDEVRTFEKGRFELVHIGGMSIGRAIYEPGWRWSASIGRGLGRRSCDVEHVGLVLAGRGTCALDDGRVIEIGAGDLFHAPAGHDSWVIGEDPYLSLHFMGAGDYARGKERR